MEIQIGKYKLGPGNPAFIVAEMSGNHGGKFERAIEIVHAAKRAGADAIKLQTYTANTITLNCDTEDFQVSEGPWLKHHTLWSLYNQSQTPWEWHEEIFFEARRIGLEVFSSPFDETAVDFLEKLDVTAYKIASPEITHLPLLERIAKTRKPVILSTGIADLQDIECALKTLRDAGARNLIVLKCTTSYPTPPEDSNLLTISDISSRFGVLAGLSDHSEGVVAPIVAVALGAHLIEKHFNLDDHKETVDSFFSSGEKEFKEMVTDIRLAEKNLGEVSYEITQSARSNLSGRRSLYVSSDIKAGDFISEKNIKCIRPSFGMHPKYYKLVIGRKAATDLKVGDRLTWKVID